MFAKQKWSSGLLVAIYLISLTGCGLTRSKASTLISEYPKFANTKTATYDSWAMMADDGSERGALAKAMSSLGYIDSDGKLTPKGETAKKDWKEHRDPLQYEINVGKRELVEVTGLSESTDPTGSYAEATFTWHWAAISDVGKEMGIDKKTYTGEAQLQKFDDGWRVSDIRF